MRSGHLVILLSLALSGILLGKFLRDFYGGLNLTWDLRRDCVDTIPTCHLRGVWDLNEIHLRFWDPPNLDETERGSCHSTNSQKSDGKNWNFAWKQKCCLLCTYYQSFKKCHQRHGYILKDLFILGTNISKCTHTFQCTDFTVVHFLLFVNVCFGTMIKDLWVTTYLSTHFYSQAEWKFNISTFCQDLREFCIKLNILLILHQSFKKIHQRYGCTLKDLYVIGTSLKLFTGTILTPILMIFNQL